MCQHKAVGICSTTFTRESLLNKISGGHSHKALSNGAIPKLNFLVSRGVSVVMSSFFVFGLSYGRSGNEFCAEEGQNPIFDSLPRNEKLCGNL